MNRVLHSVLKTSRMYETKRRVVVCLEMSQEDWKTK